MPEGWLQFELRPGDDEHLIQAADWHRLGHSAVQDQELLRSLLACPTTASRIALMPLGYPRERELAPIAEPKRRPFGDVVHRERW